HRGDPEPLRDRVTCSRSWSYCSWPSGASGLRSSDPYSPVGALPEEPVSNLSRFAAPVLIAMSLAVTPLHADHPKAFGPGFGTASPIYALGNSINVTYYGWEETTVFGHTLWAFTAAEYAANLGGDCYSALG